MVGRTLHDRLWDEHSILQQDDGAELLHLDRIVLHERSGPIALRMLEDTGREPFDPDLVFGTLDHVLDTRPDRASASIVPGGNEFIDSFRSAARKTGIRLFDVGDPRQGIAHVIAPEQGIVLPGLSLVCSDSHTCSLGGVGALAWGIGISDMGVALATQTMTVTRPKTMRINVTGALAPMVAAKDIILRLIGQIGASAGRGYMVEFTGDAICSLSMEGRMTICNMGVEFAAWSAIVAPDDATISFFADRPFAPSGADWDRAVSYWQSLRSDDDAVFDREVELDASAIAPQITWGTSPQHVTGIDEPVPDPSSFDDPGTRKSAESAMAYMGLEPGRPVEGLPVDAVFIGSCTNARLGDLRSAAEVVRGRKIDPGLKMAIVVPGSAEVKRRAEAEGLDAIFKDAGFEWREPGCSLCFYAGGEAFPPGARVATTTNRNFENRQGPGIKSHLMSPVTAAASALVGRLTDPRKIV